MRKNITILLLSVYLILQFGYGFSELTHEIMHAIPEIHGHEHVSGHHVKDHHVVFNQMGEMIEIEQESSLQLLPFLTLASYVNSSYKIVTDCSVYILCHCPYIEGQSQHYPPTPHLPPLA